MKKVTFVFLILALLVMTGITGYAFFDKTTVSESERRELATAPEFSAEAWKNSEYQQQLENFIGDHVWNREYFITIGNRLEEAVRLPGKSLILKDVTEKDDGNDNRTEVMVLSDRIVPLYNHSDDNLVYFFESCSQLFSMMPDVINQYFMIAPGRIEYEEDEVTSLSGSAQSDALLVYQNMDDSITNVPVFDAVGEGVSEHGINNIYYRTDHHWSQLGAYYAAREFLKAAGKEQVDLDDYECMQGYDFQGYLTVKYGKENVIDPDPAVYYIPKDGKICPENVYWKDENTGDIVIRNEEVLDPNRGGYYCFVEESQFAYAVIDGKKDDGSALMVVSDSYGLALVTWLTEAYDTIIVVDPRYYEGVDTQFYELFAEYHVTDFLLCLQAEEMRVNLFNVKMAENLLGVK